MKTMTTTELLTFIEENYLDFIYNFTLSDTKEDVTTPIHDLYNLYKSLKDNKLTYEKLMQDDPNSALQYNQLFSNIFYDTIGKTVCFFEKNQDMPTAKFF